MNATAARTDARPPLRLHRPDAGAGRMTLAVCREFGGADALTLARSLRSLLSLRDEPDAAAAGLVLSQLLCDRLDADGERCADLAAVVMGGLDAERQAGRRLAEHFIRRSRQAYQAGRLQGRRDILDGNNLVPPWHGDGARGPANVAAPARREKSGVRGLGKVSETRPRCSGNGASDGVAEEPRLTL